MYFIIIIHDLETELLILLMYKDILFLRYFNVINNILIWSFLWIFTIF